MLVSGGQGAAGAGVLNSAELYYPDMGTWLPTSYPLVTPREFHTATLLLNGKVLVSGGYNGSVALNSAELYF